MAVQRLGVLVVLGTHRADYDAVLMAWCIRHTLIILLLLIIIITFDAFQYGILTMLISSNHLLFHNGKVFAD